MLEDTVIPRTKQSVVDDVYDLLDIFNKITTNLNIPYVIAFGTALGAQRHGGIVPWDDDCDVAILDEDVNQLVEIKSVFEEEHQCTLDVSWCGGLQLFKNSSPKRIADGKGFPLLDIFVFTKNKTDLTLKCDHCQQLYMNKRVFSLKAWTNTSHDHVFGDLRLRGPTDMKCYLDNTYGDNWNDIAYQDFDHNAQKPRERVVCRVVTRDCLKRTKKTKRQ